MALLLRDREAAPEAAVAPPNGGPSVVVPDFACEACGAGMQRGQDWCLECGTAARGRLGARPGWRSAFTVVGLTLLLVSGVVMASYAAQTSDAERTASAPTAGNGAPIQAQTPGITPPAGTTIQPGATGPGTTPPAGLPPGASSARPVIPTTRPALPLTSIPSVPKGSGGTTPSAGTTKPSTGRTIPSTGTTKPSTGTTKPSTGRTKPSTSTTTPATQQSTSANDAPQVIELKSDAATTYDPAKRPGAEFGPAANAIDGKPGTVWDVTVPADRNPLGVGVLVDLGTPYALRSLRIATPAPGFRVELYGAVDSKEVPKDVLDKRWQHLTDRKQVADGEPIGLAGTGDADKYRLFLVYVTAPAELTDPRVAIGELTLRGTP